MTETVHCTPLDEPSPWVSRFAALVRQGAAVLDVACGGGRHCRVFLDLGHAVTALDRDLSRLAVARNEPGFTALEVDLEDGGPWPLEGRTFGAVVVTNYLYRPLFPALMASLEPGGLLIYETFALGNERFGRPRNPDHLLKPGELLDAVGGRLVVIAYEDIERPAPKRARIQRICARSPGSSP
jgi:SAM-dependent methyltransferase